jgi:hypothetical protein
MAHIAPKNSCFFENLAEAALVGFVDGSVCTDAPIWGECIDREYDSD